MTNWTTFSGVGQRITTWTHDAQRGWLSAKNYPDPTTGNPGPIGPDYTYKLSGRLWTRTWARGNPRIQTTYGYNNAGDLETVTYRWLRNSLHFLDYGSPLPLSHRTPARFNSARGLCSLPTTMVRPILKGSNHSAQGCEERATLGGSVAENSYPERVESKP